MHYRISGVYLDHELDCYYNLFLACNRTVIKSCAVTITIHFLLQKKYNTLHAESHVKQKKLY